MHDSGEVTETQDLIGTAEVARLLDVDPATISRWSDERLKPEERRLHIALRLPGKTGAKLFRRADVEALRDELARQAAS
jgi:hypothetical protein